MTTPHEETDVTPYVLYVDDEPSNLVVFEAGLEGEMPVLTASSGGRALELMREHEVAVLLTDQRMPGMSGVELMSKVRAEHPDVIRMLVTAYSDVEAAVDAINDGQVHVYLRKPWEPVELKLALSQARDRYLTTRRLADLERRLVSTERMYALGVIAAGVAHEIRTPLTALVMNIELVQGVLGGSMDAEHLGQVKAALADAAHAVRALVDITNSMEVSTRAHKESEIDLKEVVELAARSVRGEARRRGQVTLDLAPVPPVRGSRTRLGQVALNLLVNALQAFDPGRLASNAVRVRLGVDGEGVLLSVEDNGPGIAPELLGHIFDPFFTTKEDGGTGLGLAISRQIVQELGGTIEVRSVRGEGTTFLVHLPAARRAAPGTR